MKASDRSDIALELRRVVDDHPAATVLGALGLGYLAGGGLFTALTGRLLRAGLFLGVRLAVLPVLERELTGLASALGDSLNEARGHGHG